MIIVRPYVPPFLPMGMTKSGNQNVTYNTGTAHVKLLNWTPHASYPSSVIISDGLIASGPKQSVAITYAMNYVIQHGSVIVGVHIYKNGTLIGSKTESTSYNATRTISGTITTDVAIGDTISMYAGNASTVTAMTVNGTSTNFTVV